MSESKDSVKLSSMFSERGSKLLLLDGFKFTKNRRTKIGQKWRCCVKTCSAQLFTNDNDEQLLQAKVEHNHEPPHNLHRKIISNRVKVKCKAGEASSQPPAKIIKTEIESAPDNISEKITKEDVDNIRRSLYYAKKSEVSKFIEGIHKALDSIPTKTTEAKNEVLRKAVTNKIKRKQEEDLDSRPSKLVKDELAENTEALQHLSKRDIKCIRDNVTNHRLKKLSKSSSLEAQEVELSDVLSAGSEEMSDLCMPNGSPNKSGSSSGIAQEDSFDLFGRYIASLLRGIGNPHALKLQSSITSLVTKAMCDTNQTKSSDTK